MPDLVIYTPKKKLVYLLLISASAVVICIWELTFPAEKIGLIGSVAAYAGIPLSGLCVSFFLWRLLSPEPAVIINDTGLFDNASAISVGLIPWPEISRVQLSSFQNKSYLAVYVDDLGKYLRRANRVKRVIMRANQAMAGTAITIPIYVLSISSEEFLSVVEKHLRDGACSAGAGRQSQHYINNL